MKLKRFVCNRCDINLDDVTYHPNSHYCKACRIAVKRIKNQRRWDRTRQSVIHENCFMCGKSLTDPITAKRKRKFCSSKCNFKYYWLTVLKPQRPIKHIKCKICTKVFRPRTNQIYCSVYCHAEALTAYWRNRRKQQKLIKVVAR